MKIIVTGAAGFIGSRIARRAVTEGHSVVGIDSFTDYYDVQIKERNVAPLLENPSFTLVRADLNDIDFGPILDGATYVFHQAGQPGVRMSWGKDFDLYTRANISATQRLLEAVVGSSVKRLVYASSSSVYGDVEAFPMLETFRPTPVSPYGVTKLAAEHLCVLYAKNFGVPTVSLRYFTVYGPGQRPDMAFTRFVRAAVEETPITIFGSGEQIRDFTYVDDIVEANFLAATVDSTPGSVFNVAGGSNISVNEVLSIVKELHGAPVQIDYVDPVAGDVVRTGGGTDAIESALGWNAQVDVRTGIARQYEWARETYGGRSR